MSIVDRIAQGVKDNAKRVERMTSRRTAPEDGEKKITSSQRRIEKRDQERRVRTGIAEPEPMEVALPPVPLADPEVRASVAVDFLKAEVNILRGEVERLKESNPEGIPPPTPEGPANVRWTSTDTYNGPFALAERTNGSIMCLAGAVHAPGGVYEWTDETEVTISENEYAVITFTLTGSGAVYSAVLSAKATLATLVDTATTRYVVIGKKVGTGYGHLQWQYGNIFLGAPVKSCIRAAATLPMVGSYASWTAEYATNTNVLEVVEVSTWGEIYAYVPGVYHVDIYVDFNVKDTSVAVEIINADDVGVGSFLFDHTDYACSACAGTITLGEIDGKLSASFDLLVGTAGDHWRVNIVDTAGGLNSVKWNVHLVQAYATL